MRFEKKDTKFKNIYGLFVVVLAFAVIAGLIWIWIACDKYQKHSASTMVRTEIERLSEELGVELSCDMVPKKSEDGSLGYTLKNGNVKTARVYLVQDGNGIMNLAMYRIAGTEGLLEFSFVAEEGCSVCAGETELQFTAEPFVFKGTEEINAERFGLPKFCIYTVSGLLSTDNISVSKDAEVLSMTGIQDDLSFASKRFDEQTAETIRKRVNTFNQTYAYYLSKHISLGEVKSYIASGSRLYKVFSSMEISWYSNHQKAEFSRMLTSEPVYLSENIALVNSSFNFDLTRNGTLYTIPTEVSWIVCRDNSGIWKMLDCHMNLEYSLEMSEIQ